MEEFIARQCDNTYAARFWALRLFCTGIIDSFSSLLLLPTAIAFSSWSSEAGPVGWVLATSLLDTDCLVNESGGECPGGGAKDEDEASKRREGSKAARFLL